MAINGILMTSELFLLKYASKTMWEIPCPNSTVFFITIQLDVSKNVYRFLKISVYAVLQRFIDISR